MKHKLFAGLVCLLLLLAIVPSGMAQTSTTGQIIGTVKDPSGAVVPGAKVTLTSAAGEKREATADPEGNFRIPLVPPGSYTLAVSSKGFKPMTAEGVVVKITETTQLTANLQLESATESVNITAEPPLVQATSPTEGRVVGETQVKELPLPTRNFQQLLSLSPGTVSSLPNTTEMGRGDVLISVGGQRTTSNNVIVDGTEVNSPGTNATTNLSVPSPDTVQEFIVQTSMYDATVGRNAGGNIALVTKSGTNQFHGSAFEFFRNRVLNANDYFYKHTNPKSPILNRNQFGGTLGGPIIKDKTFFFVAYQGTRERNGASLANSLTTPNIPSGLTDDRSDATLQNLATTFGAATLNPISKALLQAKLPNGQYVIPSAGGTAASPLLPVPTPLSGISTYREDQFNVNIDQQITAANHLSGKFFFSDIPQFQSQFTFQGVNAVQVPGYGGSIDFHNRVFTLADTHVFNPNLINEARFGFSRIDGPSTPQEPFVGTPTSPAFGINNPLCTAGNTRFCGMPTIGVTGLFTIGSTSLADQRSTVNSFQYSDMMSWTHGRHFLRFGGEVRNYQVNFYFNFFSRGQIAFADFKNFLQGTPLTGLLGNGIRNRHYRATDLALFVQDDYRVTDSLTLNLGLRIGRNGGISDKDGYLSNFNPAEFATTGGVCSLAAPCTSGNGFHLLPAGTPLNPNDWHADPRFGFAYKPRGTDNLVLRGGFGVYFDRFSTRLANLQIFNYPTDIVGLLLGPAAFGPATFANPFPNLANVNFPIANSQVPSPVTYNVGPFVFPVPISGIYVDSNYRTPYVYQYNFGVQYEPVKNWMLDLGYVGSTGRKGLNIYTLNQGATGTAPYGTVNFTNNKILGSGFQLAQSNANSYYNSLQTSLTKRFSKGLQFLASYTWSRSIDYNSGQPFAGNEFFAPPGNQQDLISQRAESDFDRPHRFVFSGLYDLPKMYKGDAGFGKQALNGWSLSGIITLQSGIPFSVICGSGNALYNRADLIAGQNPANSGSVESRLNNYFNTAAFAGTCANTAPYGTSPRNFLRGPNQRNVDIGILKFFPVTERQKIEFRTEFFNAFNMVNFANPNNVIVSGVPLAYQTTGKITSTSAGPRVIQFALKYSF
jgi:hypothetical protein